MTSRFTHKHLIQASSLSSEDISFLFDRTSFYLSHLRSSAPKRQELSGISLVFAFFENSTRTRMSFETAARELSADLYSFQAQASSTNKGESLLDTIRNLEAMRRLKILIMRHPHSGAPDFLSTRVQCSIVNGGDGWHQHPTQGLLDAFTLKAYFGEIQSLRVCIVGDILHSRVARSNIEILKTLGAEVAVCAPGTLLPRALEAFGVRVFHHIDDAVAWADALNMLRIQNERMDSGLLPFTEYPSNFGLRMEKLHTRQPVILHPGPINRGVELSSEVADSSHSLILQQVEHGVAVRMAVLASIAENLRL